MRKILLFTIALTCFACSPQKRLAYLLTCHPELHHSDTILRIDTLIIKQAQTDSTTFTLNDLILTEQPSPLDSSIAPIKTENVTQSATSINPISVSTNGCDATITSNGDGSFKLKITQNEDTIKVAKQVQVPVYITKTEYKDKIIYKMNDFQKAFFWIGIILCILTIIKIAMKFIK